MENRRMCISNIYENGFGKVPFTKLNIKGKNVLGRRKTK
jgi:hypothetical protein